MTEWTTRFTMHLRMGGGKSGYSYDVMADGKPTGIACSKWLQRGRVTSKILSKGEDNYDMLHPDHTRGRMEAWLEAHREPAP